MQSAKCVNSTLGLEDVEPVDYASERTLLDRKARLERKLAEHLAEQKRSLEATMAATKLTALEGSGEGDDVGAVDGDERPSSGSRLGIADERETALES